MQDFPRLVLHSTNVETDNICDFVARVLLPTHGCPTTYNNFAKLPAGVVQRMARKNFKYALHWHTKPSHGRKILWTSWNFQDISCLRIRHFTDNVGSQLVNDATIIKTSWVASQCRSDSFTAATVIIFRYECEIFYDSILKWLMLLGSKIFTEVLLTLRIGRNVTVIVSIWSILSQIGMWLYYNANLNVEIFKASRQGLLHSIVSHASRGWRRMALTLVNNPSWENSWYL